MSDDRDRICPHCDSASESEWDPILLTFYCACCGTSWRRRPGRNVPTLKRQPSLLPSPPLDFDVNEWPEDERAEPRRRTRG